MRLSKTWTIVLLPLLLTACVGMPEGVRPVTGFELDRYLGKWYEIARLDHSFERGLEQVSAEYSLREDGGVRVVNRGFSSTHGEWVEAEGKAFFVQEQNTGFLKVSFFGPFYGSYIVFELEKADYSYAFVSGPDTSYLWLLAREPVIDDDIKNLFTDRATELSFDLDELVWVKQDQAHQ